MISWTKAVSLALQFAMLERRMIVLLSLAGSLACHPPITSSEPGAELFRRLPEPLAEEQARAQLDLLHQRYQAAARDGLTKDECAALTSDYQNLYERDPSLLVARFNVAVVWEACGDVDRAEAIYGELADRQHPEALNNLGVLAWSRSDHQRALELFERAVAADRTHALAARNNLAMAAHQRYLQTASRVDFEAAEAQLKNVLAVDSRNQLAYESLARLYYDRGRLEDPSYLMLADLVVTQAQRVLEADGKGSADLYNIRGLLWMQRDDPARAIRAFQQAVELESDHVDANRNVAMIAIRFRDYELAERALETVSEMPTVANDVEVWLALGVARRGLRDYQGAEAAYRRALKIAPDDPRAWFNLGVLAQDHLVEFATEGDEWIELSHRAAEHFRTFVTRADHPRWREHVAEAKDRIAVAKDTVETIEYMNSLALQPGPNAEPRQAEIDYLLELETEATSVELLVGPGPRAAEPSPP